MSRFFRRFLGVALVLGLLLAAGAAAGVWWALNEPYQGYDAPLSLAISRGQGASQILNRLAHAGVLRDARLARAYLIYRLGDPPLIAGDYRFDGPLTLPQVLDKLIRGQVVTWPVTLIEGQTLDEVAEHLAREGFGSLDVLRREVRRGELIADLDPQAEDLEGYLYPDTYRFARGTPESELIATLVGTFRRRFREQIAKRSKELSVRQLVILASIIEKEARLDTERPLIASVYTNRLQRGIGLYADPTIIYALKRQGVWDGNLRRRDLQLDSPYNTYLYPGLPPGPICSPRLASLIAAVEPADTSHLYFVSRNDGTHVFADTLREHNRNVERWQRQYWRQRWAEERRGTP